MSGVVDTLLRAHQLVSRGEHDAAYAAFAAARAAARSEVLAGEEEAKLLVLPLGEPAISKLKKKKSSPGLVISRSVPLTLALLL